MNWTAVTITAIVCGSVLGLFAMSLKYNKKDK